MSQWTHMAATIRFDALRMAGMPAPNLGNTCTYESDQNAWDLCNVPCGSEGSLQYHVWENPSPNDLAAYTAMIWGDLRDYGDVEEITEYLNQVTDGHMIRQGVAEIEVEGGEPVVLRHDRDQNAWVKA